MTDPLLISAIILFFVFVVGISCLDEHPYVFLTAAATGSVVGLVVIFLLSFII